MDSAGTEGDNESNSPSISADGRYVAFESFATDLVAGDTNGLFDIFVHDRLTDQTTRVSVDSAGNQGNGGSYSPSISGDGRYVAFHSCASNLVSGDTNLWDDIFVHDRQTGVTTRVSVDSAGNQGNRYSNNPCISADGRYVAFYSKATNLVSEDTNGWEDIFVHDRQTGDTTRVSVDSAGNQANERSYVPWISADGRYVTFQSLATNLVSGDTNGAWDLFVHDRQTGQTTRVSVDSAGNEGNGKSTYSTISADGRYVAFASEASNLVPSDTNGYRDLFVRDRQTGQTSRVSLDSAGNQANGDSNFFSPPAISADGRYVAFMSEASNLVTGDTNGKRDIFVHDRETHQTIRVSVDSAENEGNGSSYCPAISADGRCVAFWSYASNLVPGDTNGVEDVFVSWAFLPSPIPILETYPNEAASGGNCYLYKTYNFTLENTGDLYIQLTGLAHNGAQNGTGDDDDLSIQLDGTFYGWNNEDSLDGNAQHGSIRTVNLTVSSVSAGPHTLILWADETPTLLALKVSQTALPEQIEAYPNEEAPGGNCYPWKSLDFTLSQTSDIYIQLTGLAQNGSQNGTGDDDDLGIMLDGDFYGWNNADSLDGNAQAGSIRAVSIYVPDVAAGSHTLTLYADETPILYSLEVSTD